MTDSQRIAARDLIPVPDRGWLNGFSNLFRKELVSWWGPRFWWMNLIRWTIFTNGLFALVALAIRSEPLEAGQTLASTVAMIFFGFCSVVIGILVIVRSQGSVIGERQAGTAAWVLSKPVSRQAFIVSKLAANAAGIGSFLAVEGIIAYWNVGFWAGQVLPLTGFIEACGLWILNTLFYLSFTLMMGTLMKSRGAVTGSAVGLLIVSQNAGMLPVFANIGPFRLMIVAPALALGQPAQPGPLMLVATTALEIIVMAWVAGTRFAGEEL